MTIVFLANWAMNPKPWKPFTRNPLKRVPLTGTTPAAVFLPMTQKPAELWPHRLDPAFGFSTVPDAESPAPLMVMKFFLMATLPWYVPGCTTMTSPA